MGAKRYDVAILGTGIAGGILGMILARKGLSVLMIEAGLHPRFAVGESTIPVTSLMARLMGKYFDVPELLSLGSHHAVSDSLSSNCGVKKGFGFIYHRPGRAHDPREVVQTYLPHPEIHLYRQDIDANFAYSAVSYGADLKQGTRIAHIDVREDGVYMQTDRGVGYECDYLVDGCGFRSPLAINNGLREQPTRFGTHSRTLFTHMIDVELYDKVHHFSKDNVPLPWGQTTLHHLFDRGWLWVIPFNNVTSSKNPLCSVGLTLDPRVHPMKSGQSLEQEFEAFIARYPSIAKQFKNAHPVRPWIASGERLQYSASASVGDRYCLLPHSSGFVDALYSKGLAITSTVLAPLAQRILEAVKERNFSAEYFSYIDQLTHALLDCNDRLVEGSFLSFKDFDLFNCWWRIWLSVADWKLGELMDLYEESGDPRHLPWSEEAVGWSCREPNNHQTSLFFNEVFNAIKAHDRGEWSTSETINFTMEKIRERKVKVELADFDKHYTAPPEYNGCPEIPADYPSL